MQFCDPYNPTERELRDWAVESSAIPPMQDWDLVLSWKMETGRLRTCVELAGKMHSTKAMYFLQVLYSWVSVVAKDDQFETYRSMYDRWLESARGAEDAAVNRWRHKASLVFQGREPFERDCWWAQFAQEIVAAADPS